MSTSLSIESLPAFRRPTVFGGMWRDPLWQIEDSKIGGDHEAKTAPHTLALGQGSRCFWESTKSHWQIPKTTGRGFVKMAWAFSLSAECGVDQVAAEQFAQHFDGLSWVLSSSHQAQCHTAVFQDIEENWWCQVRPSGISEVGTDRSDIAYQMTELGILLYQRLQSAPPFRYALVGVEVDEFRTYSELVSEVIVPSFPGLVLAETVWRSIGASALFRPFSTGYVWQPYEGEVYKPLMVSPDLKNKLSELLVFK